MIKALIFDFDGLILDTETPEYQSWQEIYQQHGCTLSLAEWGQCIGAADVFDPYALLETLRRGPVDRDAIRAQRRARFDQIMETQSILPGVEQMLQDARRLGLRTAIASSSRHNWVSGHLRRFGLEAYFEGLSCRDYVERAKPDPALYLYALQLLGVEAHEAIAFEDSPNGALAARRAGLYCVVVPNSLTAQLSFGEYDLQLPSLAHWPLETLLEQIDSRQATR